MAKELALLELYKRGALNPNQKLAVDELYQRGDESILSGLKRLGDEYLRMMKGQAKQMAGAGETTLTIGSAALAEPVSGIGGIAGSLYPGKEGQGARLVQDIQSAMTYQPRTAEGQQNIQSVGEFMQPVADVMMGAERTLGDFGYEHGGALGGAIGSSIPTVMLEAVGLNALRPVSKAGLYSPKMFVGAPAVDMTGELDLAKKMNQGLDRGEKSKLTRLRNKRELTPDEESLVDDFEKVEKAQKLQGDDRQRYILRQTGISQIPKTDQFAAEISDLDAKFTPFAELFIGNKGDSLDIGSLTYERHLIPNEKGNLTAEFDILLDPKDSPSKTVRITSSDVEKHFGRDAWMRMTRNEGADDLLDFNKEIGSAKMIEFPEGLRISTENAGMSDILDHPELYKAYPQLKNMDVNLKELPEGLKGSVRPSIFGETPTVDISTTGDYPLSTMVHEAQHVIQDLEGWPRGGNPANIDTQIRAAKGHTMTQANIAGHNAMYSKDGVKIRQLADDMDLGYIGSPRDTKNALQTISRAAWNARYADDLYRLRNSEQPQKFGNYSNFYRDANEYRKVAGVEPKRHRKHERKNWWRGLIDYSMKKDIELMPENEYAAYHYLRNNENAPSISSVKAQSDRLYREFKDYDNFAREWDRLDDVLNNIEQNSYLDSNARYQAYRDLTGEAQARATQERLNKAKAMQIHGNEFDLRSELPFDTLEQIERDPNFNKYPFQKKNLITSYR